MGQAQPCTSDKLRDAFWTLALASGSDTISGSSEIGCGRKPGDWNGRGIPELDTRLEHQRDTNLIEPRRIKALCGIVLTGNVGGASGNAVNNMIDAGLQGVGFVVANTDARGLAKSPRPEQISLG